MQLKAVTAHYPAEAEWVWVQEEPLNMGAATFVRQQLGDGRLRLIGRPASGVTAEGLTAQHKINQAAIIQQAINVTP